MNESQRCEQWLPLADRVVKTILGKMPAWVDADALMGAGGLGLLLAIRHHNPARCSTSFETYARIRIHGAVMDELRRLDHLTRRQRENGMDVSYLELDAPNEDGTLPEIEDKRPSPAEEAAQRIDAEELLRALPEKVAQLFRMYYWGGMSSLEIASECGVTESAVCRLMKSYLGKIRERFAVVGGVN